ncbi:hypothetical protein ES702_07479 [subsurface metagenome]
MLLKDRTELEELKRLAGRSDQQIANERLVELEEEAGLDEKEIKLYVSDLFPEEKIEEMPFTDQLGWIINGLYVDLVEVNQQILLNTLKASGREEEIKKLQEKKIELEKRRLKKQEETIKAHQDSGVLPAGSVEALKEMRQKGQEYAFHPESLDLTTKFKKFSEKQLSQKREYLSYRIKEREEESSELRDVTARQQKENAEKVLERIGPKEYPT